MTDLAARVAELNEVVAKMTPGTFSAGVDYYGTSGVVDVEVGDDTVDCLFVAESDVPINDHNCWGKARECRSYMDAVGIAYLKNHAPALVADLMAENRRLREALERLLSIQGKSVASHWEGCDSSQGHSVCYSIKLIRAALAGKDGGE